MDYDQRETLYTIAAGAVGLGTGMLTYKYRRELGVLVVKAATTVELLGVGWLKRQLNMDDNTTQAESSA